MIRYRIFQSVMSTAPAPQEMSISTAAVMTSTQISSPCKNNLRTLYMLEKAKTEILKKILLFMDLLVYCKILIFLFRDSKSSSHKLNRFNVISPVHKQDFQ